MNFCCGESIMDPPCNENIWEDPPSGDSISVRKLVIHQYNSSILTSISWDMGTCN